MPSLIAAFQDALDTRDVSRLEPLFAEGIVFHTSASGRPVVGKAQVRFVLEMLLEIFDELSYVGEYVGVDGLVLLSTGSLAGKRADGVQVISLDSSGQISQFRDFVRPLSALTALSAAAGTYMEGNQP